MINIHKEVFGQGQPVVLIHGWAMHTGIWREFAQQLGQHYQVTCLDLPGHGRSESVTPYTLQTVNNALIAAMPAQPCCVLGWSLGATVALALAKQFPQRVDSLILLAGNPQFVQQADWPGVAPAVLNAFADNLQLNCQLTLIRFLALQVNNLPESKALLKQLKLAIKETESPTEFVLQSALGILKQTDLRKELQGLTCPVTVIQGDKDSLIPEQVIQQLKKLKPEINEQLIKGAGHVPFLSHQSKVIEIINTIL